MFVVAGIHSVDNRKVPSEKRLYKIRCESDELRRDWIEVVKTRSQSESLCSGCVLMVALLLFRGSAHAKRLPELAAGRYEQREQELRAAAEM